MSLLQNDSREGRFTDLWRCGYLPSMKRSLLLLTAFISTAFANPQLPQMSDKTEWLGYFVGWEERNYVFGIGADGELNMQPKKSGKVISHRHVEGRYLVQEEIKGKWVTRSFLPEGGLVSYDPKGLDPEKPVTIVATVTGDTKVEWVHMISDGRVVVKPRILEKKTENPVRVGFLLSLPTLYRIDSDTDKRELKKKLGSDAVEGRRLKDGKKVRVKFVDVDEDINSEENLKDGASEIEVKSDQLGGKSLIFKQSADDAGRIELEAKGPLHKSFKMMWWPDPAKLGEKDCFVTFSLE